jgi:2-hydroxychromene-2-carboxylate isomerase
MLHLMVAPALKFYFDFSCPYAYIASTSIEALALRCAARLEPRPILLGGVFRARATPQNLSATLSPAKARHNLADIHRQAAQAGVPLRMPKRHPMRTVEALRALLVVGEPFMALAHEFFKAYWVEGLDLTTRAAVGEVLRRAGHDADAVLAKLDDPAIKAELRERTDEAIAAGVFGVPACVLATDAGPELVWGADRLAMVEALLREQAGLAPLEPPQAPSPVAPIDLYFDYSSPFAYLACHRAEQLLGDHARWRPMLLGAVFKQVGTADVPMFEQNQAKRRHTAKDLERQAAAAGAPFVFPSRFPMRTVLALRLTLAARAHEDRKGRKLVHALFRALWAEDRDISDPAELERIADACGLDGAKLVAQAEQQPIKDALFESTRAAVEAGVFGAPTFIVQRESGPELFWGADRLELALALACSAS